MKYKFIALSIIAVVMLNTTACSVRSLDTKEVKVIEKTNNEARDKDSHGSNKGSNDTASDLNEKGEVLQKDTEQYIKSIIDHKAKEVLSAIKSKDMDKLSAAVHPTKGVRFSPYSYVNESSDLVFSSKQIKEIESNATEYLWGNYDGSGLPIKLTFSDYYERFLYDADFINAKEVGYNRSIGKGNTENNSFQYYKNSIIVEYHFPEIDPQYNGIDWRSLRLVFEKLNDTWYIVGIIHDQWTI